MCLISETHLNKNFIYKIKGYLIYHSTHPSNNRRGRSAVIVKDNIKHYEESMYETCAIQTTAVNIQTKIKNVTIEAIYCPLEKKLEKKDYLGLFQALGDYFIIGGNYNAKHTYWGFDKDSTKDSELLKAALDMKCEFQSTGKSTY